MCPVIKYSEIIKRRHGRYEELETFNNLRKFQPKIIQYNPKIVQMKRKWMGWVIKPLPWIEPQAIQEYNSKMAAMHRTYERMFEALINTGRGSSTVYHGKTRSSMALSWLALTNPTSDYG